ncbi:tape measure protein [Devosia neptuniae]|uniref:Tape measure protein n=1 Tax=Devosia neptuniae TaxID=191302 RepID=A0ABY6CEQ5_9HYPH|nr:tape measure protein [Devosia neptuniae]UXN70592.1 tape measure protein [Devosia neptuniae]
MSDTIQTLLVSLEARVAGFDREMKRAVGISNKNARSIETRFQAMNRNVSRSFSDFGGAIGKAFAGAAALRGAQQLIDTSIGITNSLKVAGLAGEELNSVYDDLFASAQRNYAPLEALTTLYGRAAAVQDELGASSQDLIKFTDNIAIALRVNGKSAAESSGALMQLGQALGSARVQAEEFNSINEGARPILQAAAAGILEAGGSVAKLKALVNDGKISNQAFFQGIQAGSVILEEKLVGAEASVSNSFIRLQNVLIDTAGKMNEGTSASTILADGLQNLSDGVEEFGAWLEQNGEGVKTFFADVSEAIEATQRASRDLGQASGLSGVGRFIEDLTGLQVSSDYATGSVKRTVDQIERLSGGATDADLAIAAAEQALVNFAANGASGFGELEPVVDDFIQQLLKGRGTAETAAVAIEKIGSAGDFGSLIGQLGGLVDALFSVRSEAVATAAAVAAAQRGETSRTNIESQRAEQLANRPKPAVTVKPITAADYPVVGGSGGRRSGGGGQSPGEKLDDILKKQAEENRLLEEKTALQATLNPLVSDYGFAVEKLRVAQELQSAATAAGIELTPALKATIDELATGYANASVEAEKLAESQEQIKQIAADFGEAGKSAIQGFISDLREGKSAADALSNAMASILDSVIQIGINALLGGFGGGGGLLGALGGLFGFAGGGYTGAGGKNEPAGVVHKGEVVWSQRDISRAGGVGVVEAMRRGMSGYANGGYVGSPGPVIGRPANDNGAMTVRVELDSDMLHAQVVNTAGRVVAAAAPTIVRRANDSAPDVVAQNAARFGS